MQTKTFKLKFSKVHNHEKTVGVVIVAAGSASRMGGANKITASLKGKPVISHTLSAFEQNPLVGDIVLVTREDMILPLQKIADQGGFLKVTDIIKGGNCREESVRLGFERLIKNENIKTVLIHDGARPLVSKEVIDRVITAVEEFSAVVPAVPVKDTIKKTGALGRVECTVDRENLVNIQTPQGFKVECFKEALLKAGKNLEQFTDDASIVEAAGKWVYTVMGDYKNIKITTPEDMVLAEAYLKSLAEEE